MEAATELSLFVQKVLHVNQAHIPFPSSPPIATGSSSEHAGDHGATGMGPGAAACTHTSWLPSTGCAAAGPLVNPPSWPTMSALARQPPLLASCSACGASWLSMLTELCAAAAVGVFL